MSDPAPKEVQKVAAGDSPPAEVRPADTPKGTAPPAVPDILPADHWTENLPVCTPYLLAVPPPFTTVKG
jgi:hypothetical protein